MMTLVASNREDSVDVLGARIARLQQELERWRSTQPANYADALLFAATIECLLQQHAGLCRGLATLAQELTVREGQLLDLTGAAARRPRLA